MQRSHRKEIEELRLAPIAKRGISCRTGSGRSFFRNREREDGCVVKLIQKKKRVIDFVALEIAQRTELTDEQARSFESRLTDADRKALMVTRNVNPKLFPFWATSTSVERRAFVATYAECESPIVHELARDPDAQVRLSISNRDDVAAAILHSLARDKDVSIRVAVASSPRTDAATLKTLSKYPNQTVAAAAKKNGHYEPGFFEKLFS